MENTKDIKPKFSEIVTVWWIFFWRYAAIFVLMLLVGGLVINYLGKVYNNSTFLFIFSHLYGLMANVLVSILVFKLILGKKVGKSKFILVPAVVKRKNPESASCKVGWGRTLLTWWGYFWRFALFAFAIGFTAGFLDQKFGGNILGNAKILGNLAVLPGSFLVFFLLMWRKGKRRKLDIVKVV